MLMICPKCGTENRDGAMFCKGCGSALAEASPSDVTIAKAGLLCAECGHDNKPTARFCAKCGSPLAVTTGVVPPPPRPREPAQSGSRVAAVTPAPAPWPGGGAPDSAPPSRHSVAWLVLGLISLAIIGAGAWWMFGRSTAPTPVAVAASPVASEPAPNGTVPVAAAPASVPAAETTPAVPPTASVPAPTAPVAPASAAATPATPPASDTPQAANAANPNVEHEAADRRTRDQVAREQADREAKARVLADQQRVEIERLKAERDAARRQAEEQRVRAQQQQEARPAPTAPFPVAQPRTSLPAQPAHAPTVKELCARSGNVISQGLCEARECVKPKNWDDPYCKQQPRPEQ
jgi:ribosomal protein L40E